MLTKVLALTPLALIGLLISGIGTASGQFDQVFQAKGAPNRGTISDSQTNKDQIVMDMGGVARTFPVNEVTRVTYSDEPTELNNARNAVQQRNYNSAIQELAKLGNQRYDRAAINSDIDYYKALSAARLAMTEGGDKAAAMQGLFNWVRGNANSYHFYEAAEVLGDLAVSSGKYVDAAKYYGPIASAPWGDYQMRANNAIGRALIAQKQFPDALARFDAVLATELSTAEAARQKQFASVGRAVCLAETGAPADGIKALEDIIAKNDAQDTMLFAKTYNALGHCYLKLNKPKDAVHAYLHTDILFYGDAESHAEALYRLSKLWNDVNKADRAVTARNTLRERYPGSLWASLE